MYFIYEFKFYLNSIFDIDNIQVYLPINNNNQNIKVENIIINQEIPSILINSSLFKNKISIDISQTDLQIHTEQNIPVIIFIIFSLKLLDSDNNDTKQISNNKIIIESNSRLLKLLDKINKEDKIDSLLNKLNKFINKLKISETDEMDNREIKQIIEQIDLSNPISEIELFKLIREILLANNFNCRIGIGYRIKNNKLKESIWLTVNSSNIIYDNKLIISSDIFVQYYSIYQSKFPLFYVNAYDDNINFEFNIHISNN